MSRPQNNESQARYRARNREKLKAENAAYDAANPEKLRERQKRYRERNRARVLEMSRAWREANPEGTAEYRKSRLSDYAAHAARRRASQIRAMPSWCEVAAIEALYALAKILTEDTGVPHSVDHIVPLQSERVCGLHCLSNLQILELLHNQSKGNRNWPDM